MSESHFTQVPGASLRTILIIEDDSYLRDVLAAGLEAHGYRTLTAPGGVKGIELARAHLPDLVLCDIDMPGMNGRTLLKTMRADPELADRQFVLMTGKAVYADPRSAMEIGADDFLLKPFTIDRLTACVSARIERAEISHHLETRVIEQIRQNLHSTLPHEFFTPLAGIIGLTELLDADLDRLPKEELRPLLHDIRSSAQRLHRILRNYLFLLKLDEPVASPAKVTDGIVVEQAVTVGCDLAVARHHRDADLKLELEGAALLVEAPEFTTLAEELADNACSFSRKDSPITVRLKPEDRRLRLSVTDEGRGMTPKQVQQLGIFQQHDRDKFEQQGLGLGLALVRKIVQRLKGEFLIESEPGKGTTVHVVLPIADR